MSRVRVLLVDDHALVRAGIRSLLKEIEDVDVVAEASDGAEALAIAEREAPDLVITDIAMKGLNGLETARRLRERYPQTRVMILSMHLGEEYVRQALQSGAAAYLIKDAAASELELALRSVMRGEVYLSPGISRQVVEGFVHGGTAQPASEPLTPRQREVLARIAAGLSTKQIAFELQLSVKTVESHRAQIVERLGIRDTAGLVRYAMRTGLIPPEA